MKKKRKIKVPAAIYGLSNNAELQSSITRGIAPNDPSHLAQSIPTKGNGLGNVMGSVGAIAQAIPGAINTLSSPFQTSTATTGGEAAMQSISGIGEGLASGAQLGMSIGGPIGGVIGGAAGAVTGLIGKKGKEASMTSFTDYDEGTLGTGLIGAFKNRKLRKRRAAVRLNAFQNREGVAATERLLNEFNEDNTEFNTDTFEYGGSIPSSLAYVDDGELIATPDGQVSKVPEQGQPTDSNLINLPEGSRILSNTLKVPGTNKTFAELGDKMMAKKKSKGKDIYAQNAEMLNNMNNQILHDKLFNMQESLKSKKGIKAKSKSVDSFDSGGTTRGKLTFNPSYLTGQYKNRKFNTGEIVNFGNGDYIVTRTPGVLDNVYYAEPYTKSTPAPETRVTAPVNTTAPTITKPTVTKRSTSINGPTVQLPEDYVENLYENWAPSKIVAKPQIKGNGILDNFLMTPSEVEADIARRQEWEDAAKPNRSTSSLGELASGIASLAPIMSNLFTSDPEAVPANYNPYATAITNTMGRRRFNINPLLRDIEQNRNAANYSASQYKTNTGHDMAFRLQTAIAANKANAQARATENNANNQYRAEYANAMNDLGQQWVNATNLASDLNARNRAAARDIRRTGLDQLSQWAQNRELMSNQRSRDNAMLKLYDPFLQAGFTNADLTEFRKYLKKGGNK